MDNVIKLIQEKFLLALSSKNSWGKNEVELLYLKVSNEVMSEYITNQK